MINNTLKFLRNMQLSFKYGLLQSIKNKLTSKEEITNFIKHKNKPKIFMLQTPTHRNLGDHAIAYAQGVFLRENSDDYEIIEIPYNDVYKYINSIRKNINDNDIVAIHGGGNMGDTYVYEEYMRRNIIKVFKNNKVISLPQTISFSNSFYGKFEIYKSKQAYKKNKNLTLIAREKKSYEIMKDIFKSNNVILTPDIVLSLDKRDNYKRSGIVTCLRNDIEGVIGDKNKQFIINKISNGEKVIITDTLLDKDVSITDRKFELEKIWTTIRSAEVVITDRLHGMIFCAITATPCIVFKNSNHKIEESYYNWLSNLEYIQLCSIDNVDEIEKMIIKLKKFNETDKNFTDCSTKYKELIRIIRGK